MLNTHACGKGFGMHRDSLLHQHGKSVSGTVSHGKDCDPCRNFFALSGPGIRDHKTQKFLRRKLKVCHLAVKPDFSAPRQNLPAHIFYDLHQDVRSDVGLILIKDFFWRAEFYKGFQHIASSSCRVMDHRVQLSIGKGSGPALSELYIRRGI